MWFHPGIDQLIPPAGFATCVGIQQIVSHVQVFVQCGWLHAEVTSRLTGVGVEAGSHVHEQHSSRHERGYGALSSAVKLLVAQRFENSLDTSAFCSKRPLYGLPAGLELVVEGLPVGRSVNYWTRNQGKLLLSERGTSKGSHQTAR